MLPQPSERQQLYSEVNDEDSDLSVYDEKPQKQSLLRRTRDRINQYGMAFFSCSVILFALVVKLHFQQQDSYLTGFPTDIGATDLKISLEEKGYTGQIQWDWDNNKWYREVDPSQTQYVGEPSNEIDKAWDDLQLGANVDLPANIAPKLVGKTHQWKENGKYITTLGVYHALHCLDTVRRSLRPDYYNVTWPTGSAAFHLDHCIDYLRQEIMCHGDLTPINIVQIPHFEPFFVGEGVSGAKHTCRNWENTRTWAESWPSYWDEMDKHIVQDKNGKLYDTNKVNISEIDVELVVRPTDVMKHHHHVG